MALRAPRRLLTAALAGGLVTGSLLLGAGAAVAAPSSDDVVEARCGETVRAEEGQTLKVRVPYEMLGLAPGRKVRMCYMEAPAGFVPQAMSEDRALDLT